MSTPLVSARRPVQPSARAHRATHPTITDDPRFDVRRGQSGGWFVIALFVVVGIGLIGIAFYLR